MTSAPTVIWFAENPWSSHWSGKRGSARWNWNSDWLNQSPMAPFTQIQVGASSHTCEWVTSWM